MQKIFVPSHCCCHKNGVVIEWFVEQKKELQDPRYVLAKEYNPRLDRLYKSAIKCPYCKKRIHKFQTTCERCGLNKIQIAYASNKKAKQMKKEGESGKIVMVRRRPTDLPLWKVTMLLFWGLFGVHSFYVGRKVRGWISLGFMIGFILQAIIFPVGTLEKGWTDAHPLWQKSIAADTVFPLIFLGTVSLVLWISDIFGVIFGLYKYPVRLGEAPAKPNQDGDSKKDVRKVWVKDGEAKGAGKVWNKKAKKR